MKIKKKQKHICKELKFCTCSISALEPDDNCPFHGYGPYQPRCRCGKFVSSKKYVTTR